MPKVVNKQYPYTAKGKAAAKAAAKRKGMTAKAGRFVGRRGPAHNVFNKAASKIANQLVGAKPDAKLSPRAKKIKSIFMKSAPEFSRMPSKDIAAIKKLIPPLSEAEVAAHLKKKGLDLNTAHRSRQEQKAKIVPFKKK